MHQRTCLLVCSSPHPSTSSKKNKDLQRLTSRHGERFLRTRNICKSIPKLYTDGHPGFKIHLSETNNSWNKQMHRLCKDSKTQMCRLQLNTRTAHFQAKHMPGCTFSVSFFIVALILVSSVKFRISLLLLRLLKLVSFTTIFFYLLETSV